MDKDIPIEEMTMKMLASQPSSCVTSWQAYEINEYTYYTKEKDRRSVTQNNGIRIEDIWESDNGARLQIPVFKCQWVKHPNSVSMGNYGLTLVDLKNVGHKDDPCVFADRIAQIFYVLDLETGKHVVVSGK
jgi:hypothetical protein